MTPRPEGEPPLIKVFNIDVSRFSDGEKKLWVEFGAYIDKTLLVLDECIDQGIISEKCLPLWDEMVEWWRNWHSAIYQKPGDSVNYPNHNDIYKMLVILIEGLKFVAGDFHNRKPPAELKNEIEIMLKPYFVGE